MATINLSDYNFSAVPTAAPMSFGIVVSDWNHQVTHALLNGCKETLLKHGAAPNRIKVIHVPGSFELPLGAQWMFGNCNPDAVICLGCVIQGETRHFDFVCQGVTYGIQDVALKVGKPVIFGVLTDNTIEQSLARAGGAKGNKGIESAITAIKMVAIRNGLTGC